MVGLLLLAPRTNVIAAARFAVMMMSRSLSGDRRVREVPAHLAFPADDETPVPAKEAERELVDT